MKVAETPLSATVTLTGEIKAHVESDLGFRLTGRIASRTVDVGDRVKAGQVLATLETNTQTADVSSAKAGVESAEATLRQVTATFQRQKDLLTQGYTTQTNFDNAKQSLTAAQASLVGAKSTLANAEDQLSNTELRADAAGVVTARNAEAGQVVQAAATVFTVARDEGRDAVFDVYEALLAKPPAKKTVEIRLLSNPAITTTGTVREISPVIDPGTGTVRVKIGLDNPPPEMVLGAAVAGVGKFQPENRYVLPWTAFFTDGNTAAVWTVDPDTAKTTLKSVDIASYRTGEILVRSGLAKGEIVVTNGVQLLRPGETVKPIYAREAAAGDNK